MDYSALEISRYADRMWLPPNPRRIDGVTDAVKAGKQWLPPRE